MTQPWKTLSQVQQIQQQQKQQAIRDTQQSQTMQLVSGSVYDGDTLRVTDGNQQIKVRLCGIDSPEHEQAMGIAARNHLRSLLNQGNGEIIVVPTDVDRYGRTVAELFVKRAGSSEEIAINAQMVRGGYAYHYARFSNQQASAIVEHVDYVVGMSQPILDKAAHLFSVGFHGGLAAGKSIEQAYQMGCIAIQVWSETQSQSSPTWQYRKFVQVGEVEQPILLG